MSSREIIVANTGATVFLFQRSLIFLRAEGFAENMRIQISKPLQQGQQRRDCILAVIQLRDLG